jgi:hypothetical protein
MSIAHLRRKGDSVQRGSIAPERIPKGLVGFPEEGGSVGTRVDRANVEQVQAEALERRLLTQQEIDEVLRLLADPTFAVSSPVMFSAWGRRPTP